MREFDDARQVSFTAQDRRRLAEALARASDVRLFRRLQALLWVAEGESVRAAAQRAGVDRSTLFRWLQTYLVRRCPDDLGDAARPGRPREADDLDDKLLNEVLAQDPRTLGYRATSWTVPLLATHLRQECGCPVSERTLRRRLHEYRWRWKRLRYMYCAREPHVAQKKSSFASD